MSKLNIVPMGDNVLIEKIKEEKKRKSGLILPTGEDQSQIGLVLAVGPGKKEGSERVAMDIKVGMKVYFRKYGGNDIKEEDKEYIIIPERDIIAYRKEG